MGIREDILASAVMLYAGSNPDNTTETVVDDSGRGNTGTREPDAATGPQWVDDELRGPILAFPGVVGSKVEVGSDASVEMRLDDFALFAWVRSVSSAQQGIISTWSGSGSLSQYSLAIYGFLNTNGVNNRSGRPYFAMYQSATRIGINSPVDIRDGAWHAVIAGRDGNTARLIVDDTEESVGGVENYDLVQNYPLGVGRYYADDGPFHGSIGSPLIIRGRFPSSDEIEWLTNPANSFLLPDAGSLRLPTRLNSRLSVRL